MGKGVKKPRNWGKDEQEIALYMALKRCQVAYKVTKVRAGRNHALWLAPSKDDITLPFVESVAELVNVKRGRWVSTHPFDGRSLATGVSRRDVIRATIQAICKQ